MSDLDIDANTPESCECKDSKIIYPSAGHVVMILVIDCVNERVLNVML